MIVGGQDWSHTAIHQPQTESEQKLPCDEIEVSRRVELASNPIDSPMPSGDLLGAYLVLAYGVHFQETMSSLKQVKLHHSFFGRIIRHRESDCHARFFG